MLSRLAPAAGAGEHPAAGDGAFSAATAATTGAELNRLIVRGPQEALAGALAYFNEALKAAAEAPAVPASGEP